MRTPYDTYAYWLMPHGLLGLMTTVFWPSARRAPLPRRRGARSPYPGPRMPFLALAPGKMGRAVGEHTFW